ncbi:MAG: class I SAM-dependent methyltransferase [Acidimicrobiales bacterium]
MSSLVDALRRSLRRSASRHPRARRLLEATDAELRRALDGGDDVYGAGYFGEGRDPSDRAFLSGYERYDRDTSNANVAAYLAWLTFPALTSLDVGCATGFVVEALRELGIDASGVDVSPYAIEHAALGARGHIRVGDLRDRLRLPPASFDLVTAFETLEHLPPPAIPGAVTELARVARRWLLCTIPSFGPNANGPGGWYQVKVRDDRVAYYESLGPGYEGPVPYDDLYRDATGEPIEGHLTVASFDWWTARFADAGLVRCGATERRVHPELARLGLTKYWNLYVFRHDSAPEPPPSCRTPNEIDSVLRRFGLADRTASPEDQAALDAALAVAPPLP